MYGWLEDVELALVVAGAHRAAGAERSRRGTCHHDSCGRLRVHDPHCHNVLHALRFQRRRTSETTTTTTKKKRKTRRKAATGGPVNSRRQYHVASSLV